jgi:hypothetical protein
MGRAETSAADVGHILFMHERERANGKETEKVFLCFFASLLHPSPPVAGSIYLYFFLFLLSFCLIWLSTSYTYNWCRFLRSLSKSKKIEQQKEMLFASSFALSLFLSFRVIKPEAAAVDHQTRFGFSFVTFKENVRRQERRVAAATGSRKV